MPTKQESKFWYTPSYIFEPEIQASMAYPEKVELCDLSLDENGEGMAGVHMTVKEKIAVARLLDEIGIHRIGVLGYPSPISKREVSAAKKITRLGLKAKFQALASSKDDVDCAIEAGVWGVVLRKPCSDLYSVIAEPVEKKTSDFIQLGTYARANGLQVGMLAQDITRADPLATQQLLRSIHEQFGLDELCVTDSQGLGNPFTIHFFIKKIREWMNAPIAVHCHNNLGMSVANACAAVAAGAQIVHTTVNGIGHFAGMPPTDEVAMALAIGFGIQMDIHYERLYELSKTIEKLSGMKMQPHKPVTGEMMFSRSEEQKHIQELIDSREKGMLKAFYPYLPEFVGNKPKVVMGPKVTRLAVAFNLDDMGITAADAQVDEIYQRVKKIAVKRRKIVSNADLVKIAREIIG